MSVTKLVKLITDPNTKIKGIFANPPYNDKSVHEGSNQHKQSSRLHVKFMEEIADALIASKAEPPKHMRVICPASGWWIHNHGKSGAAKKLIDTGLHKVEKIEGHPFPNANISNIGIFHINFGDKYPNEIEDEFKSKIAIPAYSLVDVFNFYPNPTKEALAWKRAKEQHSPSGKFTFWRNMGEKYQINDNNFCDDKSRGYWRVIFNLNGSASKKTNNSIGPKGIATPTDYLGFATSCFVVAKEKDPNGKEKCQRLLDFLDSHEVNKIMAIQKQSMANSLKAFKFVDASSLHDIALNKGI